MQSFVDKYCFRLCVQIVIEIGTIQCFLFNLLKWIPASVIHSVDSVAEISEKN